MIVVVLGLLGLCILWSYNKTALFIVYLSSMYWVYTLYQTDLLQMMGQDAFYWSGAAVIAVGSILMTIIDLMPGRH
jgi:glycopeptide antibiotics resistance protein